jgi:organic radical activating enzyme
MLSDKPAESVYAYHGFFKRGIIFQLTLRCPLECEHCIVYSSPRRREEADTETARQWMEQIGRYRSIRVVALTGGEPFLNRSRLRAVLEVAQRFGLLVDVVTSCHWATSPARAAEVLAALPPISNVSLSADRYHLEFVPLERVRNAAEAALARGIAVGAFVVVESDDDPFLSHFRRMMGEPLYAQMTKLVERVHPAGRAAESAAICRSARTVPLEALPDLGCSAAAIPVICPDGRVMACCGDTMADPRRWESLTMGDLHRESLADIFARIEGRRLVHALRILGPKRLALLASRELGADAFGRWYQAHNICDVCRDVCTNPRALDALRHYLDDPEVQAEVALGRLLRFGEADSSAPCGYSQQQEEDMDDQSRVQRAPRPAATGS